LFQQFFFFIQWFGVAENVVHLLLVEQFVLYPFLFIFFHLQLLLLLLLYVRLIFLDKISHIEAIVKESCNLFIKLLRTIGIMIPLNKLNPLILASVCSI